MAQNICCLSASIVLSVSLIPLARTASSVDPGSYLLQMRMGREETRSLGHLDRTAIGVNSAEVKNSPPPGPLRLQEAAGLSLSWPEVPGALLWEGTQPLVVRR